MTGGYAGVGFELSQILYAHNATVYIVGRSESKASTAITQIRSKFPNRPGRLEFLCVDLSDLTTVKPGVEAFLAREQRLDVLVNNAGVRQWQPPDTNPCVCISADGSAVTHRSCSHPKAAPTPTATNSNSAPIASDLTYYIDSSSPSS